MVRKLIFVVTVVPALLGGCARDDEHPDSESSAAPAGEAGRSAAAAADTPVDLAALQKDLEQYVDTIDQKLRKVPALSGSEKSTLRKDVNAVQIARARMLGVRADERVEQAVERGRLVELPDTTEYWVVRELDYSVPYVTPGTKLLLEEIGRRFQTRLDSLGIPRYRLDITSVMRTQENQADLRRRNRNASKIVSAHEFGTTVDIAYRRFVPPAEGRVAQLTGPAHILGDSLMEETARQRGAELQAVLGRVMLELKREGKVMVMMERQQTVYHITVARRMGG